MTARIPVPVVGSAVKVGDAIHVLAPMPYLIDTITPYDEDGGLRMFGRSDVRLAYCGTWCITLIPTQAYRVTQAR